MKLAPKSRKDTIHVENTWGRAPSQLLPRPLILKIYYSSFAQFSFHIYGIREYVIFFCN